MWYRFAVGYPKALRTQNMSYGLNSLKGVIQELHRGIL